MADHLTQIAVECKMGKGRLTKEQKAWKRVLEESGIRYIVLKNNLDELLDEVGLWRGSN